MKTRNRNIIAGAILFVTFSISGTVGATENLEVITIDESKTVRMELSTPAIAEINVMLYNANDRLLYSDQITAGATFEDEFDFSSFRNGTYMLVSELGNKRFNRVLTVSDTGVDFTDGYYSFTPEFKVDEEKLVVHYLKNPSGNVGISIENESGRIFDAYYNDSEAVFTNAYDLSDLGSGTYTFHLMSGSEKFSYDFNVE